MARTEKTVNQLIFNASMEPTNTTIDATLVSNGLNITDFGDCDGEVILHITNTHSAAHDVTIKAGESYADGGTAYRAILGDLIVSVPLSGEVFLGPLESARFQNADGSLYIDFATGHTGTITAYCVPRAG